MKFEKPVCWPQYVHIDFLISWHCNGRTVYFARIRIDLYSRSKTTNGSVNENSARHNDRVFFSSSLFFCFLPISSVSSTCPTEKWRVLHRHRDRLLPRATIYRYSINHFSSYREVSACDKSVNRWTSAKRNGTGQTIRFPSMKFLRTKANTLFFQPEPRNFNFKLASQRGPSSFHMSLSSANTMAQLIIAQRNRPISNAFTRFFLYRYAQGETMRIYNPAQTRCLDSTNRCSTEKWTANSHSFTSVFDLAKRGGHTADICWKKLEQNQGMVHKVAFLSEI